MDERLSKALAAGEYSVTLSTQKTAARYKLEDDLQYATGGGVFKITKELISFVVALKSLGKKESVLLDRSDNPVTIDVDSFCDVILEQYHQAHFAYLTTIEKIRKSRTVAAVVANA